MKMCKQIILTDCIMITTNLGVYIAFSWSLRLIFCFCCFLIFKLSCDFVGVYHCLFGYTFFFIVVFVIWFLSLICDLFFQVNLGQLSINSGDYSELRISVTKPSSKLLYFIANIVLKSISLSYSHSPAYYK